MTADPPSAPPPDSPRIIRRHPTGSFPALNPPAPGSPALGSPALNSPALNSPELGSSELNEDRTTFVRAPAEADQTSYIPRPTPVAVQQRRTPGPGTAIAAATMSILSGWATGVIATDLIAGWWRTDRLFCVAIGFLTAISAAAGICGLIALLLRQRMGRMLIVVGATVGLLIFGSLFLAGAKLHPVVYAMPALPVAAIVLTLLPSTGRWNSRNR